MLRYCCSSCCDEESNGTSPLAAGSNSIVEDNWPVPPRWSLNEGHKKTLTSEQIDDRYVPDSTLSEIIENSSKFPVSFPIDTVRCSFLKDKVPSDVLEMNINSAYPVIHENALHLCSIFLNHQKKNRKLRFYKNMTLLQFINRLLSKRAVVFVGPNDHYLLLDGKRGEGDWESVGRDKRCPLTLENCLSYDEIKLAALLSVSSYTCFINDGDRNNKGLVENDQGKIEKSGVIIGLIGARLEKENVMEYREILKTKRQNTHEFGYGNFHKPTLQGQFLRFYGDTNFTYRELVKMNHFNKYEKRYIDLGGDRYFDRLMFERRISLSIDTLLIEANDRAEKVNKKAYIYVVGIGLGVWKIHSEQDKIFMDTFANRIECLCNNLTSISDVHFAYINHKMAGSCKDGDSLSGITLHFSNRNPHEKLTGVHEGKLLVVSYAWDGNAFPGNEFWVGSLSASGDPAAACSTQIAELHNCYINRNVCSRNLRVATLNEGLLTFQDYQRLHRND